MHKPSKAERVLGSSLLRQIQRRIPEGGVINIPPKVRPPKAEFHWPTPPKTERNAAICRAVLGGEMSKSEAGRAFGVDRSRIAVIVKEADKWISESESS